MLPTATRKRTNHTPLVLSGVALAVLTMVTHGINFSFTLVATRILSEPDFGTLTALLGTVLVGMAPGMAVQGLAAADILSDTTTINRRLARQLATAIAGAVAVALVAVGPAINSTNPVTLLAIAAAAGLLPLTAANEGQLQGAGRFTALGGVLLLGAAVKFTVGISGMAVTAAVWAGAIGVAAGYGGQLLLSRRLTGGLPPTPLQDSTARRTVISATVMMGLVLVVMHADAVLARATLQDTAAGLYGAGTTAARIVFWAPQFAVILLYPRLVVDQRRRVVSLAMVGLLAAGVVGAVAARFLGPLFVELAFPASYGPIGPQLWRFAWLGTAGIGLQVIALSDLASGRREALVVLAGVLVAMVATVVVVSPETPSGVVTLVASCMTAGLVAGWLRRMFHPAPTRVPDPPDGEAATS